MKSSIVIEPLSKIFFKLQWSYIRMYKFTNRFLFVNKKLFQTNVLYALYHSKRLRWLRHTYYVCETVSYFGVRCLLVYDWIKIKLRATKRRCGIKLSLRVEPILDGMCEPSCCGSRYYQSVSQLQEERKIWSNFNLIV